MIGISLNLFINQKICNSPAGRDDAGARILKTISATGC